MDYRDADMPLSSFGGENSARELNYSGREGEGSDSPTFENGIDEGESIDGGDSVAFKSTPVLRESIASPAFDLEDYNKENRLSYGMALGRSPSMRSDDVPTLVTPTSEQQSPSFDLALPIPPIASLTPENLAATPPGVEQEEADKRAKALEEGDAKVKFAPRESTEGQKKREKKQSVRSSVRRSSILSQSTDGNIFSAVKDKSLRESQAMKSSTNSAPPEFQQLALPPIPKGIMDRIATLGPELPTIQKWILWTGIVLDVIGKATLVYELNRFATKDDWAWFSCVMIFFVLSGFMASTYWLAHYTYPQPSGTKPEVRIFGFSKTDVKRIIRRFGAFCAAFQLGTAFAATRALYSKDVKQRKITMDLRGMRLVDTVFLTLSMCGLQAYIGISCSNPDSHCPGRMGFDPVLSVSIMCSLVSGTLCFTSLDLMDEWKSNVDHLVGMTLFSVYRLCEVAARILTLALFAAICGLWVFLFIALHAVTVVMMLKMTPASKKVWASMWTSMQSINLFKVFGFQVSVPVINDVSLLGLCLAWPPSCFVSNATEGASGRFWWRSHMTPRKAFSCLDAPDVFISFPIFNSLMVVENLIMLSFSYVWVSGWSHSFFEAAITLTFLWQFFALTWVSFSHNHTKMVKVDNHPTNDYLKTPMSVIKSPIRNGTPMHHLVRRTPLKDVANNPRSYEHTPDMKVKGRLSLSHDDCEVMVPASERRLSVTSYSLNEDALRESTMFTPHPAKKNLSKMLSP